MRQGCRKHASDPTDCGLPEFLAAVGRKLPQLGTRGATLRIGSGTDAIPVRARGRHRFGEGARTNDLTVTREHDEWFASVTLRVPKGACVRARTGDAHWASTSA